MQTLQGVADRRLTTAVGIDGSAADPEAIDVGPAAAALDDLRADVEGVLATYQAMFEADVAGQSADAAARVAAQLESGAQSLDGMAEPLAAGIAADPTAARTALDSLKEAKRALATEVASLLGLTLGFSDTDGDS